MKKIFKLLPIFILVFNLMACGNDKITPISLTNYCFDTAITITLYDYESTQNATELINECFEMCNNYDKMFSRTNQESDVYKLNHSQGETSSVDYEVAKLISEASKYSNLSNGAFDITIAPLTSLWDIKNNPGNIPDTEKINLLLKRVNYKNVGILETGNKISLSGNAEIDLGAIAKGYVADRLKDFLKDSGIKSAIIDLGGNILTIGSKPDDTDFIIGIKKPFSENGTEYAAKIDINNQSVVTSGIYERYFEKNGKIYHHILDPKTGYPVDNNLYSVTIISKTSIECDALSTTTFALGLEEGLSLINSLNNTEAVFITDENEIVLSDGLTIDEDNEISFR